MASSAFIPKFVKFLGTDECESNEMNVPIKFVITYGGLLNMNWKLRTPTGYAVRVRFDPSSYKIVGVRDLLVDHGLTGGEMLIFEFVNGSNFNVFIIGRDGGEIDYPPIVHASQTSTPIHGRSFSGGWKFVKVISYIEENVDEFIPPVSLFSNFGVTLGGSVTYVLNHGAQFTGYCNEDKWTLNGLRGICDALSLDDLNLFDLLVFNYDFGQKFEVSFVDGRNVEIVFDNDVLASRHLRFNLRYPSNFSIQVQPFHMLRNCHGVDISVEFSNVNVFWRNREEIKVFSGDRCWVLEVRKRSKGKRTVILGGWLKFRDDLKLNVGDKCWFKWLDESYNRFRVEIVRAVLVID